MQVVRSFFPPTNEVMSSEVARNCSAGAPCWQYAYATLRKARLFVQKALNDKRVRSVEEGCECGKWTGPLGRYAPLKSKYCMADFLPVAANIRLIEQHYSKRHSARLLIRLGVKICLEAPR
ncbi:hypothetical protein M514_12118 [Trichuris suis]|uniref:Uncharacterized protein n=1 Tax=Trichuris suis TaxID=68888 RepID=A0A085LPU2_9BILA|nr:hypothetical protein M513_12118 [Trichuris suis]KFD61860.1 hypothetical protein M514_12118 [Trichuris suis]